MHIQQRNSAEEFIAAITQHIPEKSFQMVRYYGWYLNKSKGLRLKKGMVRPGDEPLEHDAEVEIIDVSEYETKRIPSKTWRECIKKIWEVDPLQCPNCGGEIKITSFITEASVIRQILVHLKSLGGEAIPGPCKSGSIYCPWQDNL